MKRSITYILGPLFLLLLLSQTLSAQRHGGQHHDTPPIKVKVSLDKQEIVIGQPVNLWVEAFVPGNLPLTWPALDSLPHFEWLEKGKLDSVIKPDEKYYRQYFPIPSFDSGAWVIPRLPFVSGGRKLLSDSVKIIVN